MHLLYTSQTQLPFLSYRAHALRANTVSQLTSRLWPSCHSAMGGIEAWLGVFFKNKRYPITFIPGQLVDIRLQWFGDASGALRVSWSECTFRHCESVVSELETNWWRRQLRSRRSWNLFLGHEPWDTHDGARNWWNFTASPEQDRYSWVPLPKTLHTRPVMTTKPVVSECCPMYA